MNGRPSIYELKARVAPREDKRPLNLETLYQEAEQALRERETERRGRQEYFRLRKLWSGYLLAFIALSLLFQMILTFYIGFGLVDFSKQPVFLHLVIGESFAQIVGMGYIAVKYLFSD